MKLVHWISLVNLTVVICLVIFSPKWLIVYACGLVMGSLYQLSSIKSKP